MENSLGWKAFYSRTTGEISKVMFLDVFTALTIAGDTLGVLPVDSQLTGDKVVVTDLNGNASLVDSFAKQKTAKALEITSACEVTISSGFMCSALGAPHLYPSKLTDQANLSATTIKSVLPTSLPEDVYSFMCRNADGLWQYRSHTAQQIQEVGALAYDVILGYRERNAFLQYYAYTASNLEALNALHW